MLSYVRLFATPWAVAHQAPLTMGFPRQEYRSGLLLPSPGYLPDPAIKPISPAAPALQMDSLLLSHWESPCLHFVNLLWNRKKIMPQGADQKSFISFKVSYEVVKNPPETQEKACIAGDMFSIPGSGKIPWRKKWQPTLVFLPGESHRQSSLTGYSPWGHKELDTTEANACSGGL